MTPAAAHLLHRLRVAGPIPTDSVGRSALTVLSESSYVEVASGRVVLTVEGRAFHAQLVSREIAVDGVRAAVETTFDRFLLLNERLLAVCTDWQMRTDRTPPEPNDHRDGDWDAAVIDRLGTIDDRVQPLLRALAGRLLRFETYADALSQARARVEAGAGEWLTSPRCASYHSVWFEIHEDLLVTLARDRTAD